ncbi:aspartate carbamoyltransferase [Sporobacter termitidis]|uniref:aspartate carbamoyltransferase n=1 Tax=Sporobacter termitidis TaxID=44749 RepID=UPI000933B105|nr:aspartate carbamoyltransferase [Sporobacter termitidis]
MRHLISIEDVSVSWWDELYRQCCDIIARPGDYSLSCSGRVLATLFFEPSTRTNFSFQSAMMRLGGSVFGFSEPGATSTAKGETLADTVRMMSSYADAIVIRSPYEGAAMAASLYSEVPIINAGDGGHFHPTQTLADLTTISQKRGAVGNLNIGLCGDLLNGRTVHSLVLALSKFPNINYFLISPRELSIPDYMLTHLKNQNQKYIEITSLESTLPQLDILYMTRIQRERFADPKDYDRLKNVYILNRRKLMAAKEECLVMHPLPRLDEIARDVDDDPRAAYFEQARYGMFIRMALLLQMTHLERVAPGPAVSNTALRCTNPKCITATETYLPALARESDRESCAYCDKKMLTI